MLRAIGKAFLNSFRERCHVAILLHFIYKKQRFVEARNMSGKTSKAFLFTLLIALGTEAVAFGPGRAISSEPSEIRIADSKGDWGYPNPYLHYPRRPGYVRMSWVFDTLVWKDEKGDIPGLATTWTYDPQKRAFVFRLNPNTKWHDGAPFSAEDVAFSVGYFKKFPYSWVSLDRVDRAEIKDKLTVVIFLNRPYAPFISEIAGTMPILPKHMWQTVQDPIAFLDSKAFIGTGPYKFKDFNKIKGTYLFEAFDNYYAGWPKMKQLIYVKSGHPLVALSTGMADLAAIQPEMIQVLQEKGFTVVKDACGWVKKLMINHYRFPLSEQRFRQALAHAIAPQELIDKGHRGFGQVASQGLLSKDHEWYNPQTPVYRYDPLKARELIESLGFRKDSEGYYGSNGKPLKLEILCSTIGTGGEATQDRDGEILKRQIEAVGIRVDLVQLDSAVTDQRILKWNFDLAISGHGGILGDPKILSEMISPHYGADSVNCARYEKDETLNSLLEKQMEEMNPEGRKKLVYQIQDLHAKDLPAICLYYPDSYCAYNPKKDVRWFFTKGGIAKGIPIAQNKMSLIR